MTATFACAVAIAVHFSTNAGAAGASASIAVASISAISAVLATGKFFRAVGSSKKTTAFGIEFGMLLIAAWLMLDAMIP